MTKRRINGHSLSRLGRVDWDFAGEYSESRFSAIHWHPGQFPSQIPATCVGLLSERGDTVLDPFAGSGTTLVEAQRLGRLSIGVELTPVSCDIATAKTLTSSVSSIERSVRRIKDDVSGVLGVMPRSAPSMQSAVPELVQKSKWYTPRVLRDLAAVWSVFKTYSGLKRALARASFSAILLSVCRETRHWGYVCDNTTPKGAHGGDVETSLFTRLDQLVEAYRERDEFLELEGIHSAPKSTILAGSALESLRRLEPRSIGLIVTSPPYFGVCDYVKAQRLSMEWFGEQIEPLRLREIGARSKRRRQTARASYLSDMTAFLQEVARVLAPGRHCVLVLGESTAREGVLDELEDNLSAVKLRNVGRYFRTITPQRRQTPSLDSERVLVLER